MKRDMDLIRSILLSVEECDDVWHFRSFDGFDDKDVAYNMQMLIDENFIVGKLDYLRSVKSYSPSAIALTWKGHDFIDASRNPDLWRTVKETFLKSSVAFTTDIILDHLKALISKKLDISI